MRGTLPIFMLKLVGEALGLTLLLIAARQFSLQATGLLVFLQNSLFLFGALGTLGLGTTFLRFLPVYADVGNAGAMRGLIRWGLRCACVASALSALLLVVAQALGPTVSLSPLQTLLVALTILSWGLLTLSRQILRALGLAGWSEVSYQVIRPFGALAVLLAAMPLLGETAAIFAALLLPLWLGHAHDFARIRSLLPRAAPDLTPTPTWWRSTRHFSMVMVARVVLQRLDVLLVGLLLGLEAAAIYGVVARVSILATMMVEPVQSMFQPRTSRNAATDSSDALRKDIVVSSVWILVVSLVVAFVLMIAPAFWLQLFGDVFDPDQSVLLLAIMLAGRLAAANSATAQSLALMHGQERAQAWMQSTVALGLFPVVLWWAIVGHGLIGAAVAMSGVQLLLAALKVGMVRRRLALWPLAAPSPGNLRLAMAALFGRVTA